VFQNIIDRRYKCPKGLDEDAVDLIDKLFEICPTERIGYNNINEIKSHPFFERIDWERLAAGEIDDPGFDNSNQMTTMSEDDCSRNFSRNFSRSRL
jgi:hypothetical protein